MNTLQVLGKAQIKELAPPADVVTTANGTAVDVGAWDGAFLAILHSEAGSGTTPTLNAKLQSSDTSGGTYTDVEDGGFVEITDAADSLQAITVQSDRVKRWVRIVYTVAGTTPSFDVASSILGLKKTD